MSLLTVLGELTLEPDAGLTYDPDLPAFVCIYCEAESPTVEEFVHKSTCPIAIGRLLFEREVHLGSSADLDGN